MINPEVISEHMNEMINTLFIWGTKSILIASLHTLHYIPEIKMLQNLIYF